MGHFAHITDITTYTEIISGKEVTGYKGIVDKVIVAEQEFIDTGAVGDPKEWIQTSYNHRIRNVYAGIGCIYDSIKDIFYPPSPFPSWVLASGQPEVKLDENNNIVLVPGNKYRWQPPKPMPDNEKRYIWNEDKLDWEEVIVPTPLTTGYNSLSGS